MTQQPVARLMVPACWTLLLSAALGAVTDDSRNHNHLFTSPGRPVVRCKFTGENGSRATFQVLHVIYGDYRRNSVDLDMNSIPGAHLMRARSSCTW